MKLERPKIGDIIEIEFDDHIEDSDKFIRDYAWGRVALIHKEGRKIVGYTIDCWAPKDPDFDRDEERQNIKSYTIHTGTIHAITVMVPRTA